MPTRRMTTPYAEDEQLEQVYRVIFDYHKALDKREDGNVAADNALKRDRADHRLPVGVGVTP